jgi:hypothetical protein
MNKISYQGYDRARFMSSNRSVIGTSAGLVAKKIGTSKVTVIAPNGRRASVTVRVADRAEPVVNTRAGEPNEADVDAIIAAHGPRLARLARYVLSSDYGKAEVVFGLDADAQTVVVKGKDPGLSDGLRDDLWHVLAEGSPYPVYVHFGPSWAMTVQVVVRGAWNDQTWRCDDYARGRTFEYRPYVGRLHDKVDTHWIASAYSYLPPDCDDPA